jgi:NAD(P)-dependent dehydrogenase (short-subunit alcohol dehydrogenase family)/acyl carrier protein
LPDSAPAGSLRAEAVRSVLLDVVAEKTGYPVEMLEPGMALDADLGIDSIKRVEILSALQERLPDAPPVKPEHLGTIRTLQDILTFLADEPASSAPPPEEPAAAPGIATSAVLSVLLEVVAEKTGYPAEMLEPGMALDADLGIDSIKRVEILSALQERLPDAPAVKPEHLGTIRTLQDIVNFLSVGTPAETPEFAAPSGPGAGSVRAVLLEVVAEKTGYPVEMLEPGMALDADLGIDSIKRVEILSALQERMPDAPAVKPEHLGTIRTLEDIVTFLSEPAEPSASPEIRPELRASDDQIAPAVALSKTQSIGSGWLGSSLRDPGAEAPDPGASKTPPQPPGGHPGRISTEQLAVQRLVLRSVVAPEPDAGHGRLIRPGSEVWVLDDGSGLSGAVADSLEERGYRARVIRRDEAGTVVPSERLDGLVLIASNSEGAAGDRAVKDAFALLRAAGPGLRRAGDDGGAVLASVTRLDGTFALGDWAGDGDPTSGALAGLVKTAAHEWPGVACKAIDLDPALGEAESAGAVVEELLRPGPVEVGLAQGGRSTLVLEPEPIGPALGRPPFAPGDVVVVTGGARGVTAEVAVALAEAFRPTLVVLGRSPAPEPEPEWLAALRGEAEIKRALAGRANGQATPHLVGEQFRRVAANREILRNLERVREAGSEVVYRSVDVRDTDAVRAVLDAVRASHGPVRGLIHGAGVLADRRIDDQSIEQFDAIYDTKVAGLRSLLGALGPDDLLCLALFSSSTARFGRTGQGAYASANEVLNKWAQREARRRPACRVVAVNWGPWDGGMVTPSLRSVFASEGIGLIPLRDGARYLVDELRSPPGGPVEIVVLGGTEVPEALKPRPEPKPAAEPTKSTPSLATVFERPLDLEALPVLRAHVIDGRAVLPFALTLEWLAQGALQRNPGLVLCGLDDLRLLKGAILHDDRPETLSVLVGRAVRDGSLYRVPVELRGQVDGGRTVSHAKGQVVLGDRHPQPGTALELSGLPAYGRGPRAVYHDVLFHGPELQGIEKVEALGPAGAVARVRTSPAPSEWVERPLRQAWLTDPLAMDCAFQLLSLWCFEQTGAVSLPTRVGHYRQFRRGFPGPRVRVVARVERPTDHRATADIDFLDDAGAPVARVEGYECVIDASLNPAFRRNRLGVLSSIP